MMFITSLCDHTSHHIYDYQHHNTRYTHISKPLATPPSGFQQDAVEIMINEFCRMAKGARARDGGNAEHVASDGRICKFESGALKYEWDHRAAP